MEPGIIVIGLTCVVLIGFIGAECYFMQNTRHYNRLE